MKKFLPWSLVIGLLIITAAAANALPAKSVSNPVYHHLYAVNNGESKILTYELRLTSDVSRPVEWSANTAAAISLPAGANSFGLAVSEDGSKLFVAIAYPAAIRIYNLTNGIPSSGSYSTISWTPPAGSSLTGIALYGNRLYAANSWVNRVEYFNYSGTSWSYGGHFLDGQAQLFDIAVTADRIYVSQKANAGKVFVYNSATLAAASGSPLTGLKNPTYLKISPVDGKLYIAVNDTLIGPNGENVVVYNTAGLTLVGTVRTSNPDDNGPWGWTGIDLSPTDGTETHEYLYFTKKNSSASATRLFRILTADISGLLVDADYVTTLGTNSDSIAVSPLRRLLGSTLSNTGALLTLNTVLAFTQPVIASITPAAIQHPLGAPVAVVITGRNFSNSAVKQTLPALGWVIDESTSSYYPDSIKNIVIESPTRIRAEIDGIWTSTSPARIPVGTYRLIDNNPIDLPGDEAPTVSDISFTLNLPEPQGFEGNNPAYGMVEGGIIRYSFDWLGVGENSYAVVDSRGGVSGTTSSVSTAYPGKGIIDYSRSPNTAYGRRLRIIRGKSNETTDTALTVYSSSARPTGLTASAADASSITLSWSANGNPSRTLYEIERNGAVVGTASGSTIYTDSGLADATRYRYRVRAKNDDGYPTNWTEVLETATAFSSGGPTSEVIISNSYYGPNTWTTGIIRGTASAGRNGFRATRPVEISIRHLSPGYGYQYWDGNLWNDPSDPVPWHEVSVDGFGRWEYNGLRIGSYDYLSGYTYEVFSRTTDRLDFVQTPPAVDSFIWDTVGPTFSGSISGPGTISTQSELIYNWSRFDDDFSQIQTYYYLLREENGYMATPSFDEIRRDGRSTTVTPVTLNRTSGRHRFHLVGVDNAGNPSLVYSSGYTTVQVIGPAEPPANVSISIVNEATAPGGKALKLDWSASPTSGTITYKIFRGTAPFFTSTLPADWMQVGSTTSLTFTDTGIDPATGLNTVQVVGDVNLNYYYAIIAETSGGIPAADSIPSGLVGELDINLVYNDPTANASLNWIPIPFVNPAGPVGPIRRAADLWNNLGFTSDSSASIDNYSPAMQNLDASYFGVPEVNNFDIFTGKCYQISALGNSVFTIVGNLPTSQTFDLTYNGADNTNYNWIFLPFNRGSGASPIVNAAGIFDSIGAETIETIEHYDPASQGYDFAYFGVPDVNNFPVKFGECYRVSVTQGRIW